MEAPHASVGAVLEDAATAAITALMGEPGLRRGVASTRLRAHVAGHVAGRDGADHRRRRADPAGRARGPRAQLDKLHGAAFDRRAPRRRAADRPARLPRLHHRRPAPSGCPTSSATCAARRGGWSGCTKARGRRPRPDEGDPRARGRPPPACSRSCPPARVDGELSEVPWLLEELRISYFAQAIGPKGQVTPRKIRRILDEAAR